MLVKSGVVSCLFLVAVAVLVAEPAVLVWILAVLVLILVVAVVVAIKQCSWYLGWMIG